jgi:hypothetical protein
MRVIYTLAVHPGGNTEDPASEVHPRVVLVQDRVLLCAMHADIPMGREESLLAVLNEVVGTHFHEGGVTVRGLVVEDGGWQVESWRLVPVELQAR